VNVLATPSGTVVAVGTRRFAGDEAVEGVAATVAARLAREPGVPVDVRADAALAYSEVEPALKGIALAAERSGPTRVSVRVCVLGEGSGG
jgi:hypothetical protein